ncbi:Arm DNA-binding domain-containing protein [Kitasatospora sp. NBC_01246]|uniref:Arm DNA-binding domain-containing protein n=1 Tax=Kitasatospora sp. NBC_01246 TaxID=2903570 RepID=UPI002E3811A4|nr:phage integrase SAM-like domain-containing protein [Kitasatospora sp. NBC_01246]
MKEPIRKITHKDGSVRYRLVVDIGVNANGKRKQLTRTFKTKNEALAELSRIRHELGAGTFVAPSKMTLNGLLDIWLKSATRDIEEGTASNYESAMVPVRTHSGDKELQSLTEEDIEALVDWMLTSGRRRGGKPGTGLGIRSVRLALGRLRAALNLAVRRGLMVRNVAQHVTISREAKTKAEAAKPKSVHARARSTWADGGPGDISARKCPTPSVGAHRQPKWLVPKWSQGPATGPDTPSNRTPANARPMPMTPSGRAACRLTYRGASTGSQSHLPANYVP